MANTDARNRGDSATGHANPGRGGSTLMMMLLGKPGNFHLVFTESLHYDFFDEGDGWVKNGECL